MVTMKQINVMSNKRETFLKMRGDCECEDLKGMFTFCKT